ncbi:MAG: mechanosensitive ion channel family protein [Halomonadaceae bacterium]|nr:MAG: mechanosensitive ion channel family protein [Halomonadaceae bacterium]
MENLTQNTEWAAQLSQTGATMAMNYLPKLVLALVTLVVGLWLIRHFVQLLETRLTRHDPTLGRFVTSLASVLLKVVLLISVASMVGIATTSFIALLGAAGLAVGLALQGSLSNFAGGVLILTFKPFKVGDTIEAQGFLGGVNRIMMLYTVVDTFDKKQVIIPNAQLSNASVVNYSVHPQRRVDLPIRLSYGDSIEQARELILATLAQDERVLQDPAPMIVVGDLCDSWVELKVRFWSNGDVLWPTYWSMQEQIKLAFDGAGLTMPFPQRQLQSPVNKQ